MFYSQAREGDLQIASKRMVAQPPSLMQWADNIHGNREFPREQHRMSLEVGIAEREPCPLSTVLLGTKQPFWFSEYVEGLYFEWTPHCPCVSSEQQHLLPPGDQAVLWYSGQVGWMVLTSYHATLCENCHTVVLIMLKTFRIFNKTCYLQSLQGPWHKCLALSPEPREDHHTVHRDPSEDHNLLWIKLVMLGAFPS